MTTVRYEPQAGDQLECEHGSMCCWQTWNGVDSLEEGDGRHALTVLTKRQLAPALTCNGCGAEVTARSCTSCAAPIIAKALFRTDPRAIAVVDMVSDAICYVGKYEDWDMDLERQERAWETAWRRNEGGLRTESEQRARDMLHEIRTATPEPGATPKGGE